jgi:hypothetical protein
VGVDFLYHVETGDALPLTVLTADQAGVVWWWCQTDQPSFLTIQVVLKRPLRDEQQRLPVTEVAISLPSIKTSLSDTEYMLITSVAGANFSEPLRMSDEARCAWAAAPCI